MDIQNYSDTLDTIIGALQELDAYAATGIPADNILIAGGDRIDLNVAAPFCYVSLTPSDEVTIQGYVNNLDIDLYVCAEPNISAGESLRDSMTLAGKVLKYIDDTLFLKAREPLLQYEATFSNKAIISLHFITEFLPYEQEGV